LNLNYLPLEELNERGVKKFFVALSEYHTKEGYNKAWHGIEKVSFYLPFFHF